MSFHLWGFISLKDFLLIHYAEYDIQIQAELEESNEKEGPEIEEARSTIAEVEQLFQTTEA